MEKRKEVEKVIDIADEEALKKKARKISVKEAGAWSFMDGFGLKYITPYALALGATNTQIGILSSVPDLLGNLSQLYTYKAMLNHERKKIIRIGTLIQALMWLPILGIGLAYFFLGLQSQLAVITLIVLYSVLVVAGDFVGPAWTSWMKDLVTENSGIYFGFRSRVANLVSLITMLIAGFILDYSKHSNIFIGFCILFAIAFIGRSVSSYLFTKKHEPHLKHEESYFFSFLEFLKRMPYNNFGKFTMFVSLLLLANGIAAPFFAVYLLRDLSLKYIYYTIIIMAPVFSTLVVMPIWGRFSDRYGNRITMRISSFIIPIIPLMWIASIFVYRISPILAVVYLTFAGIISGAIWAGFNLSSGNFLYDAVTRQRMAICAAYYSLLTSIGAFVGTMIGSLLSIFNLSFFGLPYLLTVFAISAGVILAVVIFGGKIEEVRFTEEFKMEKMKFNLRDIKPKQLWDYLEIKNLDI